MDNKRLTIFLLTIWMALFQGVAAHAADPYPSKPIRLVVPYAAGGDTDVVSRKQGQLLTQALGQQIVVDNRPGANGIIGTELVAKAPADGYTLLMGATSTHVINPFLYRKLRYDPLKDFVAVSGVVDIPMLLVVSAGSGVKSLEELIALAKAKPGELAYASAGSGSPQHLAGEMLKMLTNVDLIHVPYKGGGPAILDVAAGQVPMMFAFSATALPYINNKQLVALAATTKERIAQAPAIPTVSQAGVPGLEMSAWMGVFAPAGTPKAIVDRINAEVAKAIGTREMKQALHALGGDAITSSPQQFADYLKAETEKWGKVVKASGAKID